MSSSSKTTAKQALLAQLAEQLTLNQRVAGSSPAGGISASSRQDTSNCVKAKGLRQAASPSQSSRHATESDINRPLRATHSATRLLPDDPDLASVLDAWGTNKGDIHNCCGKMPSLRRGGLSGSFNLPRKLGVSPLPNTREGRK
jgi:hypothetical protein